MISTELGYSYDSMNDIHSFNPLYTEKPTRGRPRERSTIIVQNERGVTTILVYKSEKTFNNIVELHSVETQTGFGDAWIEGVCRGYRGQEHN